MVNNKNCIYQIRSLKLGHVYIGGTCYFCNRKSCHLSYLKFKMHKNRLLQAHYNEYGRSDLVFEILEGGLLKSELIQREQFYIDTINPYFNICRIAGSGKGIYRIGKPVMQFTENGVFIKEYPSLCETCRINNYASLGNLSNCLTGSGKTAYGFKWQYK